IFTHIFCGNVVLQPKAYSGDLIFAALLCCMVCFY
ncbi:hypothetical protein pm098_49030, partial [Escherichia coli]